MAFYDDLKRFGDSPAIIDDQGQCISYRELDAFCGRMGACLERRKLAFSFCENGIASIGGYVGFLNNRVVPVLLDRNIEEGLRDNLIELYRPEYLYMPEEMESALKGYRVIFRERGYVLCRGEGEHGHPLYEELALLLTSSGSTGSPKLVRQSYENIQVNAASIAEYLAICRGERPITTLPMNYTYGLSIINSHLLRGAAILATNATLMDRRFWQFFKEREATSFGGVPYTYEILKKLRFFRMDLPSLKTMTQAGGKLTPELHREFAEYARDHGKQFVVMYGQCEATARMAYLPAEKAVEKYGSMGIPIPGGTLELMDARGDVISEADAVGELVYYGKNVTLGYGECREDLSRGDERHGRLETGDMAKRDEDGYYFIVGRKKRFLKIFGNRVNLDEAERMVKGLLSVGDCACGGVDDKLFVFLAGVTEEEAGQIIPFLAKKTKLHSSAFTVKLLDKIPKNQAGKTQYGQLAAYMEQAQG